MKNILSVIGCLAALFLGSLFSCEKENPAGPQPPSLVGDWKGEYTESAGGNYPDTFGIELNLKNATEYTLMRGIMTHSSSANPILDSAYEDGTWAQSGNTVTLTPAECKVYDHGMAQWSTVSCGAPKQVPVAISGNTWTIVMATEWKTWAVRTITYPAVKQ